jgi:hypothetical protein
MATDENEPRIIVDEDWKTRVEAEKEQLRQRELEQPAPDEAAPASSAEPTDAEGTEPPSAAASASHTDAPQSGTQGEPPPQLPPATFRSLVETLSMQAMASLSEATQPPGDASSSSGDLPDPRFHLAMAKYLIDTLGILEQKTQGNLSDDEARHLEETLHDLRMAFVAIRQKVG